MYFENREFDEVHGIHRPFLVFVNKAREKVEKYFFDEKTLKYLTDFHFYICLAENANIHFT